MERAIRFQVNLLRLTEWITSHIVKNSEQKNSISRFVKGMYLQMGEICREKEGGKSIYGGEFADESFHVKHTDCGLLGMCKRSWCKLFGSKLAARHCGFQVGL